MALGSITCCACASFGAGYVLRSVQNNESSSLHHVSEEGLRNVDQAQGLFVKYTTIAQLFKVPGKDNARDRICS